MSVWAILPKWEFGDISGIALPCVIVHSQICFGSLLYFIIWSLSCDRVCDRLCSIVKILSINSCWSIFHVLQHFNRKNRSDYLSVASVDHTIDLELHCNHLIVWCIDLCVEMLLVVLFWFNMGLLAKTRQEREKKNGWT